MGVSQWKWTRLTALAALLAAAVLGSALISQYGFGLEPCVLCIYQRWPYVAILAFSALALLLRGAPALNLGALLLAALAADVSIGLGVWHSGVEWKWFPPPDCAGDILRGGVSLDGVMGQGFAPLCDDRIEFLFGLSMANWNVLVSFGLSLIFVAALLNRLGVSLAGSQGYSSSSASQ